MAAEPRWRARASASAAALWAARVAYAEDDPASLARLADILPPEPPGWWPPAPGWYAVLACLALLALHALFRLWRDWRCNAYRRAALRELERLDEGTTDAERLAGLLKRTALAAAPRREVAALCGESWLAWLQRTGNGAGFSGASRHLLGGGLHAGAQPTPAELAVLRADVRVWIVSHRTDVSADVPGSTP